MPRMMIVAVVMWLFLVQIDVIFAPGVVYIPHTDSAECRSPDQQDYLQHYINKSLKIINENNEGHRKRRSGL